MTVHAWMRGHSQDWLKTNVNQVTLRAIHDLLHLGTFAGVNRITVTDKVLTFWVEWRDATKGDAVVVALNDGGDYLIRHEGCDRDRDGDKRERICPHEGVVMIAVDRLKIAVKSTTGIVGEPGWYFTHHEVVERLADVDDGALSLLDEALSTTKESEPDEFDMVPAVYAQDRRRRRSIYPIRPPVRPRPLTHLRTPSLPALVHIDAQGRFVGASLQCGDLTDPEQFEALQHAIRRLKVESPPVVSPPVVSGVTAARAVGRLARGGARQIDRDQILDEIGAGFAADPEKCRQLNQVWRSHEFRETLEAQGITAFRRVSAEGELGRYAW